MHHAGVYCCRQIFAATLRNRGLAGEQLADALCAHSPGFQLLCVEDLLPPAILAAYQAANQAQAHGN